jgi:4-amino-4-deoxy-L-arabinose transferase-like glycosyltransferase
METQIDSQQENQHTSAANTLHTDLVQIPTRYASMTIDLLITAGLFILALIPRLLLAQQLDVVTDEVIYIFGGKTEFHLLTHWLIGNSGWDYNYEHPPLVKLLIGFALYLNDHSLQLFNDLLIARLPSCIFGSLFIAALYWLGRAPFGRIVALAAALCLVFSPWLAYFSALAYLDMTMTALITIAYLLLWPAIRCPRLYMLIAVLVALAVDSKYTGALAIPGMLLFTLYYFLAIRPRLPHDQQPVVPWRWWLLSCLFCSLIFLAVDPAIWLDPVPLLLRSFQYEWNHASDGHLTFLAGTASLHAPQWAIFYIAFAKVSGLVMLPALFFVLFATIQLLRFHLPASSLHYQDAARYAFLLIWLLATLAMFSRLDIVVGTHYFLPLAPSLALAGATGLSILLHALAERCAITPFARSCGGRQRFALRKPPTSQMRSKIVIAGLFAALTLPHLFGLVTTYRAEGYTSEFFRGENTTIQVAYPGYRDAVQWLALHTDQPARIGLVGFENALGGSNYGVSWYSYNSNLPRRFQLTEAHPDDYNFPYDYLVWPMHLIQRGYSIPAGWKQHVVHTITGGNTIYCYILARNPTTIT